MNVALYVCCYTSGKGKKPTTDEERVEAKLKCARDIEQQLQSAVSTPSAMVMSL